MFQIENDTFDHRVIFFRTFLLSWYWVYLNNSGRTLTSKAKAYIVDAPLPFLNIQ